MVQLIKWIVALGLIFQTDFARAEDSGEKIQQIKDVTVATALCEKMSSGRFSERCFNVVQGANFFDSAAVSYCEQLGFSDAQLQCIETIQNRIYQSKEINVCLAKTFDRQRLHCMKQLGREIPGSI